MKGRGNVAVQDNVDEEGKVEGLAFSELWLQTQIMKHRYLLILELQEGEWVIY